MGIQETLATIALTVLLAAVIFFLLNLKIIALIIAVIGFLLLIASKFFGSAEK